MTADYDHGGDVGRGLRFGLGAEAGPVVVETHWLHGYVQRDTVAVDQEVTVTDRTPPEIVSGSLEASISVSPQRLHWTFSWDEHYPLRTSVDRVVLSGPGVVGGTVTLTPANTTHVVTGGTHWFVNHITLCEPGQYTIEAEMTANGQTRTETLLIEDLHCLVGF